MAAILRDSTVVVVVVVVVAVVRTRPRAIPLSMINHEKIHTWVSFSYMVMGLRLAALRAAGAPLLSGIKLPLQFEYDKLYFFRENFETNENEISMLHVIIIFSLVSGTSILTVDQQP